MITLNAKDQLTVDVIVKVAERKITIANAAKLLNKSRRTIRYLRRYRDKELRFIVHGNAGSEPANKIPETLKQQIQALIREKYYDLCVTCETDELVQQMERGRPTPIGYPYSVNPSPALCPELCAEMS